MQGDGGHPGEPPADSVRRRARLLTIGLLLATAVALALILLAGDGLDAAAEPVPAFEGTGGSEEAAESAGALGDRVAGFLLAAAVVLLAARLCGAAVARLGQPQLMGEILAGILLGPSLFGAVAPEVYADLFTPEVLSAIEVAAHLGLVVYVFLVGMELESEAIRGRGSQLLAIATASFVVPFLLGAGAALAIYERLAPDVGFAPFALFLGTALAVTALPALARILDERRMLNTEIGQASLTCAALIDTLAWILVTTASALAVAGMAEEVAPTVGWTIVFALVTWLVVRPALRRTAVAYDDTPPDADRLVGGRRSAIVVLVYVAVLVAAWVTESIGIALVIGALAIGAVMPRGTNLSEDTRRASEGFVSLILLPLFFAYAGLRTDIGLLDDPEAWVTAIALLALAVAGKLIATPLAARASGYSWYEAGMLGALMNTRGLTALIVVTVGLELAIITETLFTALVLMALVTTFMAAPLLAALESGRARRSRGAA